MTAFDRFACWACCLILLATAAVPVRAAHYDKEFYANTIKADAKIAAGGIVETWYGSPRNNHEIVTLPGEDPIVCKVCDTPTKPPTLVGPRPGLPIALLPGGVTVSTDIGGGIATYESKAHGDAHTEQNLGASGYIVETRDSGPKNVRIRQKGQPLQQKVLNDYVKANVFGNAFAGTPTPPDKDRCHAADSAAGVMIQGAAETFRVVGGGDVPVVVAAGRVFTGGAFNYEPPGSQKRSRVEKGNLDPYYVSLVDLTTGETSTEVVMQHTMDAVNGHWEIDDTGIRLVVSRDDPEAFVDLAFDQPSSWVLDPYSYSAHLDINGLVTAGELTSGWTVSTLTETVEAFYAFDSEGMPFDYVEVAAPAELFNPDHDYTYDVGAGDGAFERVLAAVPEPSSFVLACGILAVLPNFRRRG